MIDPKDVTYSESFLNSWVKKDPPQITEHIKIIADAYREAVQALQAVQTPRIYDGYFKALDAKFLVQGNILRAILNSVRALQGAPADDIFQP
jgi:hypothetical protein